MATVDDKVVAMSFESSKFESGVSGAIGALDKLKRALNFPSAGKGLEDVAAAANKVDLSHISNAVDGIKSKFSLMSVVGISAINSIVNRAVGVGAQIVKSFAIDPVKAGFQNYETQINAIQTILANTGLKGKQGLGQVNSALADLNKYANLTVYNFSEMAKNIGTFTAAGVDLKTSTESIKGIANLAALSGSSSLQASTAMYQLSQAIASGRTKLQDWNSVVNAGMGGQVFQKALFNTGAAMGTIKGAKVGETFQDWTAKGNSFRDSLKSGWLTSKVLTTTLKGFTGDMTTAQLKAVGYTDAQVKNIQEMGKTAVDSATKIKTFTQLQQALKEEVGTAWAAIFKTIFGNINDATTLFSKIHTAAENALTTPIYALNNLLESWVKLGGRAKAIDGFKNALKDLGDIIKPIKEAFREIFPTTTAQRLYDLTNAFDKLAKKLKPSPETVDSLKRTFAGLFAILDIGKQILSGIFTVFGSVFGAVATGGGSFLKLTAHIGDFLVKLDESLKKGGKLQDFFKGIAKTITAPILAFGHLKDILVNLFTGFNSQKWDDFLSRFPKAGNIIKDVSGKLQQFFGNFGPMVGNAIKSTNWGGVLAVISTGLLGGIFVLLRNFFKKGLSIDLSGGLIGSVKESLEGLTGALKSMQQNIKANTLLQIAVALGILAGSIVLLSRIPQQNLDNAMTAIAVSLGELLGAMKILDKIGGSTGFIKLPLIATGLIALAIAIGILSLALKLLSTMNWQQLTKGLEAIGALLAEISVAVIPLSANSAGMVRVGIGITGIAIGLVILAEAVKLFGSMNWKEMGRGLAGVAGSLVLIALGARAMPKNMLSIGVGMLAVGAGVKILADAVVQLGSIQPKALVQGLFGLGGSLVLIATAVRSMPPNLILQGAGLLAVGIALESIAKALKSFGNMTGDAIAKSLITLGIALGVLAIGLNVMTGTLAGAAALAVAAVGLNLLGEALKTLGNLSWDQIAVGLAAIAGSIIVIGLAGTLLAPAAPAILALGVALLVVGAGIALAGAGVALFGAGLSAIAVSGPASIAILVAAFDAFITTIPKALTQLATGIVQVVTVFADAAPKLIKALGKILDSLLQVVINEAPRIGRTFGVLIDVAIQIITQNMPKLIQTGINMIVALIQGISRNVPKIVKVVGDLIVNFLNALSNQIPKILQAGVNLIGKFIDGIASGLVKLENKGADAVIKFLNGTANAIRTHSDELWNAGWNIVSAIFDGMIGGIKKLADKVYKAIPGPLRKVIDVAAKVFQVFSPSQVFYEMGGNLMLGLANGITDNAGQPVSASEDMANNMLTSLQGIPDAFANVSIAQPTITPVVDLSKVQDGANKLTDMINTAPVIAPVTTSLAASVSPSVPGSQALGTDSTQPSSVVTFNQSNYSPAALSDAEIYRQTRNTVSQLKSYLLGSPFDNRNLEQWAKPHLIGQGIPT